MKFPKTKDTQGKPAAAPRSAAGFDRDMVRELADILNETGLTDIEIEHMGMRVRVSRQMSAPGPHFVQAPAPASSSQGVAAPAPAEATVTAPVTDEELSKHPGAVTSPMVGTAYVSPQPGAPPFVKVGDTIKEGQTLFIVEAMKTMNPIPAPKSGRVTRILLTDAQPVEYGQVLMIVE